MKKISAFLTALILLLNMSFAAAVSAEDTISKEEDMLITLGLIDSVDANKRLSREEYAKSILACFGYGYEGREDFFSGSTDTQSAVGIAANMQFLGLADDGGFNAEGDATFGEIVRGLVTLLGYDYYVKWSGKTARSYFEQGQSIGITDGIAKKFSDYVTEKEYAKMLLNCLEIPVLVGTYKDGSFTVSTKEDENFLSRRQHIYKAKGVMTANEYTTLSSPVGVGEDSVCIDDTIYKTGKLDCNELLGYFVEFYYMEEDDEFTLLWIYADSERNNEIYLEDDEIVDFNDGVYTYSDGKRDKDIKLSSKVSYIYNNKAIGYDKIPAFIPENGEVTFVDNNNDGKHDVVSIMNYVVGVVDDINAEEQYLYVTTAKDLMYELESYDNVQIYSDKFEEMDFTSLEENKAVWIAEDIEKTTIMIISSDETVEGTVSGIGKTDMERPYVEINGTKYAFSIKDLEIPSIGENGTFYLDVAGRIVGYETVNVGYQISWLLNAYVEMEDEYLYFKMFDGDVSTYKVTDNFSFNGIKNQTYEDIISELKNKDGKVKPQIIRYKMNANKEISFMQTATESFTEENRLFVEGTIPKQSEGQGSLFKKNLGNFFTNAFALEDNATVLVIPNDLNDYTKYMKTGTEIFGNDGTVYGVTGYKLNPDDDKCIAAVYDKTISAGSDAVTRITSVLRSINDVIINDEEGFEIKYYELSTAPATITEKVAYTTEKDYVSELGLGDVIRVDVDADNKITALQRIYSEEERALKSEISGGYWGHNYRGNCGTITQKLKNSIKFSVASSYATWLKVEMLPLEYCAIYISEPGKNGTRKLKVGTKNDIATGDDLVYTSRVGQDIRVIIYKD